MEYLLLIYNRESDWAALTEEARGALYKEYYEFTEGIRKSGHYKGGNPLQPVATATTVKVRDGKTMTTDGPFAETREQLGGYYLIDAANLDEAIGIGARIPSSRMGAIEVRPIQKM
ncbi:MAG TPA: YciI family protein [Thermoanaerobaculia bacterium]|nr:YciI family protein [Thermoanaerobaculia bacterium]